MKMKLNVFVGPVAEYYSLLCALKGIVFAGTEHH